MSRPRDQVARRAQLVEAAAAAILDRGASAMRLRDVAERAGVTPASVLYYYPDTSQLLLAVFEHAAHTYLDRRRATVAKAGSSWERLTACIHSGVPFPGEAAHATRLLFEILPVAFRQDTPGERQVAFVTGQRDLYADVLQAGEEEGSLTLSWSADDVARSLVALEDGLAIDVLSGTASAEEVEKHLVRCARLMCGVKSHLTTNRH